MIFIKEIKNYNHNLIKESIAQYFNQNRIYIKNEKILLKPNLISPKSKNKGINTHPTIVSALAEYLIDYNNKVFIGDSPGVGTLKLNLKIAGYSNILNKYNIKLYPFKKNVEIKNDKNKVLKKFKISSAINDFQKIINIAKLKTHCMTGMTLSVKNCYGFIIGKDKVKYHLKAGYNINLFADILIDIYLTVKPFLNIIDGILGMEGNGPTSGNPMYFNIFSISENGFHLDRAIEQIVGFKDKSVITKQAEERGLLEKNFQITHTIKLKKIKHAKSKSVTFRIPKFLSNFLMIKPQINNKLCKKCMKCYNSCPPSAISIDQKGFPEIDYSLCIKCFCCHELCIYNAVKLKRFFILQ